MRKTTCTMALAALVLFPAGSAAFAQQENPPGGTPPILPPQQSNEGRAARHSQSDTKGTSDQDFVKKAARGGLAEVKLGELAQEKGSSDAVKDFGKRMATDHKMAGDKLTAAASKDNMVVPSDLDSKDQSLYDRLSKLSGGAFDRAYAREMVKDHQKDIAEFQRAAANGTSPAIRDFASQTLPTLQEHLRQAREILQTVSRTGGGATGGGTR